MKIKFTSSRTKINAKLKIWESKCTAKVSQIAATSDPCAFKSVKKSSKEHLESKLYNMSITPEIGYTGSCMKITTLISVNCNCTNLKIEILNSTFILLSFVYLTIFDNL